MTYDPSRTVFVVTVILSLTMAIAIAAGVWKFVRN